MRLATFGDSFIAAETYEGNDGECWPNILKDSELCMISEIQEHAAGGATSGKEFAYALNGVLLETPGLITQVERATAQWDGAHSPRPDLIAIHVGTNDIVSWLCTPYTRPDGETLVEASSTAQIERAKSELPDGEFGAQLMEGYTAANILSAYQILIEYAPTVVIGPADLYFSEIADQSGKSGEDKRAAVWTCCRRLSLKLRKIIPEPDYIEVLELPIDWIDEIHPGLKFQRAVAGLVATRTKAKES